MDLSQGYAPGSAIGKKKLAVINISKDLLHKKKVPPVVVHHKVGPDMLKPALKGSRRQESKRAVTPPPKKPTGMSGGPPPRMGSARAQQKPIKSEEQAAPKVFYNNFLSD